MGVSINRLNDITRIYFSKCDKTLLFFSIIVILLAFLRIGYTYNCYGVSSEGWYTMYASLILDGKVPYKDFDLLFPPLYAYIIAGIQLIFGSNLIICRILGIIIFVSISYVAFRIFYLIFPAWISAIAATVVMITLQSENTFISYDYIQFYNLFNYVSLYFFLSVVVKKYDNPEYHEEYALFFAGLFVMLSVLIRQTSGLIMLCYYVAILLVLLLFVKRLTITSRSIRFFLLGVAIPSIFLAIWIVFSGVGFNTFLEMTVFSGSKGSITSMLFRWITLLGEIPLRPLICVCVVLILYKMHNKEMCESSVMNNLLSIIFLLITALFIVAFYSLYLDASQYARGWMSLVSLMFFINLTLTVFLLCLIILKNKKHFEVSKNEYVILFLSMALVGLQFGSGTSGGLSLGQGALNYGLVVALALYSCKKIPYSVIRYSSKIVVLSCVVLFLTTSVAVRVEAPYEWWGMDVDPYSETNCTTDLDYFSGIKLNEQEKETYENFVRNTQLYLGEDDELYCYSQVALFYTLAQKLPTVRAPIAWFDVSRNSTILEDLNYLQSHLPKMILFADHGEWVIKAHEDSFGTGNDSYAHRWLYEWLLDCKNGVNGEYTVLEEYHLDNYQMYLLLRV